MNAQPIASRFALVLYLVVVFVLTTPLVVDAFLVGPAPRTSTTRRMETITTALGAIGKKKPPLYITIGPQCSGKTTFLSQLQQRLSKDPTQRVADVTLDDQDGVYIPVDVGYFLEPSSSYNNNDRFMNRRYIGKTIGSRIKDQEELCIVLQRVGGRLTQDEFETQITRLYRTHAVQALTRQDVNLTVTDELLQQNYHTQVAQDLMQVVQEIITTANENDDDQGSSLLPNTVALFCVEALFRPNPKTNLTAVDAAARQLEHACSSDQAVAWGNTNTRPREYSNALKAAANSGRQVYFLAYGSSVGERVTKGVFLKQLEFKELLRRNVNRLLQTGKYIPAKGMYESADRVDSFLQGVMGDLDRVALQLEVVDDGGDQIVPMHSKLDFDKRLAQMANYDMKDDRTVSFVPPPTRRKNKRSKSPRRRGNPGPPPQQPPPPASSSSQLHLWRMPQPPPQQHQQHNPWQQVPRQNPWQGSQHKPRR